jgi:hypothetical protein
MAVSRFYQRIFVENENDGSVLSEYVAGRGFSGSK